MTVSLDNMPPYQYDVYAYNIYNIYYITIFPRSFSGFFYHTSASCLSQVSPHKIPSVPEGSCDNIHHSSRSSAAATQSDLCFRRDKYVGGMRGMRTQFHGIRLHWTPATLYRHIQIEIRHGSPQPRRSLEIQSYLRTFLKFKQTFQEMHPFEDTLSAGAPNDVIPPANLAEWRN